jgi:hypothetical protein
LVIVDIAVLVVCVIAQIMDVNFDMTFGLGTLHNRSRKRACEQLRKYGENINTHAAKVSQFGTNYYLCTNPIS